MNKGEQLFVYNSLFMVSGENKMNEGEYFLVYNSLFMVSIYICMYNVCLC